MQVRYVGEREVPERMSTEHLRTEERVVEETVTSPCSPMECGGGCVPVNRGVSGNGVSLSSCSLDYDGLPPRVLLPHVDNPVGLSLMPSFHHFICLPAVWH